MYNEIIIFQMSEKVPKVCSYLNCINCPFKFSQRPQSMTLV